MEPWRPLSVRQDGTAEAYDALAEGVPHWLKDSLWSWVQNELRVGEGYTATWNSGRILRIQRKLRLNFTSLDSMQELYNLSHRDKDAFLNIIDVLVNELDLSIRGEMSRAVSLEAMLRDGNSVWTVPLNKKNSGLIRRIDPSVKVILDKTIQLSARPGEHLANAIEHIYGRKPEYKTGCNDAVSAVEAAAAPIISPNNSKGTLGTIIKDFEKLTGKVRVVMSPDETEGYDTVQRMMELLWHSQRRYRHGTAQSMPTKEEAESAVTLAASLTYWFENGFISIKD